MKGLVEVLARSLVDNPAPVEVAEQRTEGDAVYRLKVGKDDLGKVIGKKGRTAKAFRTLLSAAGAKQNLRVSLEIVEPEGSRRGGPPGGDTAEAAGDNT
ncbi:MAG: hypothetical protein A2138_15185, partial [Deltaproteobacteria bacterium RBG_16_71_12]